MNKSIRVLFGFGIVLLTLLSGCPADPELSSGKEITAFSFEAGDNPGLTATVTGTIESIDITVLSTGIVVTVPYGTDLTALVAAFTAASGAAVTVDGTEQESGITPNDFSDPVAYKVTAADGTIQYYTVTVMVDPSTVKEITAFSFTTAANTQLDNTVMGTITGTDIALTVPYGTDVTSLIATFTWTGASVTVAGTGQESGTTANDFTDPVTYTVTAEDGTSQEYTVTVSIVLNDSNEITDFSFEAATNTALTETVTGSIDGNAISVTVPYGTDVTTLIASYTTDGASITVDGTEQESGTTANDFTNPVTYVVTAEDGSAQEYTVTVYISVVDEDSGFSSASALGDQATLTLEESSETLTMIYAQEQASITFPTRASDLGSAELTTRFWMGETEITNAVMAVVLQWAYCNGKFSSTVGDHNGLDTTTVKHGGQELLDLDNSDCRVDYDGSGTFSVENCFDEHPVTDVTWYGAVMFCNWLTEMRDGSTDNIVYTNIDTTWQDDETVEHPERNGYRLPSNDEWEYTARYRGSDSTNTVSGYSSPFFTQGNSASGAYTYYNDEADGNPVNSVVDGKDANDLVAVYKYYYYDGSWVDKGTSDEAAVKSLDANTLGLYDMSGNVWEWCFTENGSDRINRGGSWLFYASGLQVGIGNYFDPDYSSGDLGFRLCRTAD